MARANHLNRQVQRNNNRKLFVQLHLLLVPLTTFPSANKSTGFVIALPTATEVSISFQRPVSTAAASCARRLLRAQAWWLLTLKPLWTKPSPDLRPMHNAAHPYLEETVGGLAGPIRSTLWRDADAQYIPIQVVWGGQLCYHHVCVCCWSRSEIVSTYTHVDLNILVSGLVGTHWGEARPLDISR